MNELSKVSNFTCLPESELLAKELLHYPLKKIRKNSKVIAVLNDFLQTDKKLRLFQGIRNFEQLFKSEQEHIHQYELFIRFITAIALHQNPNTEVIVFKNTHIGQYLKAFPYDAIKSFNIHLQFLFRDPRAIYRSQKKAIGSWGKPMSTNTISVIHEWKNLYQSYIYYKERETTWVLESTYENLVQNCNIELEYIFSWLKLNIDLAQISQRGKYYTMIPQSLWHLHENISKPVQPTFKDQWKVELSEKEQYTLCSYLGKSMANIGYVDGATIVKPSFSSLKLIVFRYKLILLQIRQFVCGPIIPPTPNE